ncbi:CatB-related O-acetyltransferase [Photobacterium phosphoreum]|jgi:chloramphenicol O-acetyltransferase type B|uniref:CatB-related O-acetyltransferase n=1 Tax=Photobacterium phosphoreum TaxID=659 RepID=UPI0007F919E7|nr:CatB-related O-acetyltransferase [Photobacterium phosphoreum]MCD9469234.1 hexapeptide transferase [Photobacterium phosphoreum]MCD9474192.1 antibiotic acetyltransferase [Photobacterium phosphoreum]MCD9477739.1 antibiotic acetyltransferase [Photobacterium phosphoreum]MCD9481940.1 antibiotic acetyltransferase [Photobacterium phosphoreum]MCD9503806.1 antibiotic acetyltransferase [Photobacterium phosphoreum]
MALSIFPSWIGGYEIKQHITNPNIDVGDYSYYSGYYHQHHFEDQCVHYLLGDKVSNEAWQSGIFGEVDKLIIGRFCSIASGVVIMMAGNQGHRHDWISSFPFDFTEFGDGVKSGFERAGNTVIGNDVWLGAECVIMPGVKVGDGAVIGTRAVVTKDVEPYAVVVGNPGRCVKKRFPPQHVKQLLEMKWWDWPLPQLKAAMTIMCSADIDSLYGYYQTMDSPSVDE